MQGKSEGLGPATSMTSRPANRVTTEAEPRVGGKPQLGKGGALRNVGRIDEP